MRTASQRIPYPLQPCDVQGCPSGYATATAEVAEALNLWGLAIDATGDDRSRGRGVIVLVARGSSARFSTGVLRAGMEHARSAPAG
jgi:hypothetical protein